MLRGGGYVGMGFLAAELLGVDKWVMDKVWWDDDKGAIPLTKIEAAAADIAEWQARQAEIDARLAQIDANTHPSMRDAANPERGRLMMDHAMLQQQIDIAAVLADPEGASAGIDEAMNASRESLAKGFQTLKADAARYMAELAHIMSVSPTITPRISGVNFRGIHADIGVE